MEIKRASINEVHWSINWNASQQANLRLKEKLGDLSRHFAPLKVGHATYNWIVDTPGHWQPLAAANPADRERIIEKTEQIRQDVFQRLESEDMLASKICQVPNYEEYIFWQRQDDDDIDILITEGTMLGQDVECITEKAVSEKMAHVMRAFKYVFVLASSTDIERLASINLAAKQARKPLFVCSGLMNASMRLFTRRESKEPGDLFDFRFRYFNELKHLESMKKRGFVMVAGVSKLAEVEQLCRLLPENETLLIYSSWDGYYKNPNQVQLNPRYALFREAFHNVVDIHTSGHADRKTIRQVIETVHPKEIICIHKEKDQSLEFLGIK